MNSQNRLSSEIQGTALGKCLRAWTCVYRSKPSCESRRDQEEGGELDSQEEASPEEIKSREVVLGCRERVGLILLQLLFPNGELRTLSL